MLRMIYREVDASYWIWGYENIVACCQWEDCIVDSIMARIHLHSEHLKGVDPQIRYFRAFTIVHEFFTHRVPKMFMLIADARRSTSQTRSQA